MYLKPCVSWHRVCFIIIYEDIFVLSQRQLTSQCDIPEGRRMEGLSEKKRGVYYGNYDERTISG